MKNEEETVLNEENKMLIARVKQLDSIIKCERVERKEACIVVANKIEALKNLQRKYDRLYSKLGEKSDGITINVASINFYSGDK